MSKEFENYCHEERGWKTIGTVDSSGRERCERLKIERGELPVILVYGIFFNSEVYSTGCYVEAVRVQGESNYRKSLYRYDGNPHRPWPWAIEVNVDSVKGQYSFKYETFDDLAKKIQKAWRRRTSALKIQRWWKSVYYKPGKGPGYCLAYSSFITEREMPDMSKKFFSNIK